MPARTASPMPSHDTRRTFPPGGRRLLVQTGLQLSILIWLGALLVAASAVIHLHLWSTGYSHIHIIGPLFLLQGIAGLLVAVAVAVTRHPLIVLAGSLFTIGTAAGLLLSTQVGLFGFRDSFSAPYATVSMVIEVAATLLLAVGGVLALRRQMSAPNSQRS